MLRNNCMTDCFARKCMSSVFIFIDVVHRFSCEEPILVEMNSVSSLSLDAETSIQKPGSVLISVVASMRKIWYWWNASTIER